MNISELSDYFGLFASGIGIGAILGAFFWMVGFVIAVFTNISSKG